MKHNQLRTGVLLSYVNLALGSIIPFFYTPIMLEILGQAEYGLYSLSSSAVSYLSLLSFGFGSTIIRYISKYRTEGNQESLEKSFGFFLMLYCAMAVLVLGGGVIIFLNIDSIFQSGLTATELQKMKPLVLIMAFNSAISFPVSIFSALIAAHERFIYEKLLNIFSTVVGPIVNLIALVLGYASVGMALASTVVQILFIPWKVGYCFRVLKLKPRFGMIPRSLVQEMVGFSLFTFIAALVDMLFWSTDKVILGMLASTTAVAIYNVGCTFNSIIMNLSTSISGILFPKITGMVVKNTPKKEWTNLFIRVGRLQFIIIALIISGFSVFGRAFLELWVGETYRDSFWIAIITMLPLCIPLIQNTGLNIITAQNKHHFRSVVYLIIAVVNVIATYLAVPRFNYIGATLSSCISYLLGQGVIMNIYYYKVTGLDIPLFWKNILKMAVVPALMIGISLIINTFVILSNWFVFFTGVILFTIIYIFLMYLFAMNDYEKDFIRKLLQRIWGIFPHRG